MDAKTITTTDPVLADHADAIRGLRSRIVADVAEIGRRLKAVKTLVGHGNWLPWLEREFGWTDHTALNFIHAHEFVEGLSNSKSVSDLVLTLPVSAVYALAAPSTPDEAREAIIERAKAGEPVTAANVKREIDKTKGRKRPAKKDGWSRTRRQTYEAQKRAGIIGGAAQPAPKPQPDDEVTFDFEISDDDRRRLAAWCEAHGGISLEEGATRAIMQGLAIAERDHAMPNAAAPAPDDIGPESQGEIGRLNSRIEELTAANHRLEIENVELRRGPGDQDDADGAGGLLRAWDKATDEGRQQFMAKVSLIVHPDAIPLPLRRKPTTAEAAS